MFNCEVVFTKKSKRKIIPLILIVIILIATLTTCGSRDVTENEPVNSNRVQESENMKMNIQIGEILLTATLEDNPSVTAFKELLKDGGLTIEFSQYGGFEQVGPIGKDLPKDDVQTTTSPGDIVLYS